ncbi:MAG: hypothetical protein IK015_00030 [Treponema sp.]|nr:hypothetical protein [Treponema sp.]
MEDRCARGVSCRDIKFVKNVKNSDKDVISYSDKGLQQSFSLWFADKPKKEKYNVGDIVLLYQRLPNDNNATFTHLVRIVSELPVKVSGGYGLDVEVVGTVQVLKSVTSVCDYMSFKGNGQSGKLVRIREVVKGHVSVKKVQERLLEIFSKLGQIV